MSGGGVEVGVEEGQQEQGGIRQMGGGSGVVRGGRAVGAEKMAGEEPGGRELGVEK
eukprot:CAMPEP_0194340070 /NCGR_PEP_ID=MMETSP0171-20130528/85244_1 /TAXON_ID=218684 /ORGANISM="Corethron pennatum, Strain L29A3" /LENGTH=55 /DNA_ID=CAMNT_0039104883 /DNA_START=30 /DNA_END=195 /DNA_ORIENTATION=-